MAQREDALVRGIHLVEWTFDPMEMKNAYFNVEKSYFNVEKLGAVVRRYTPDFYGSSTSPLHGALPTDRLHAEWWLRSERVQRMMFGRDLTDSGIQRTIAVTVRNAMADDAAHSFSTSALESLMGPAPGISCGLFIWTDGAAGSEVAGRVGAISAGPLG